MSDVFASTKGNALNAIGIVQRGDKYSRGRGSGVQWV